MMRMGLRLARVFVAFRSNRILIHLQQLAIDCVRLLRPRFLITRGTSRNLGAAVIDVRNMLYQTQYIARLYFCICLTDTYE